MADIASTTPPKRVRTSVSARSEAASPPPVTKVHGAQGIIGEADDEGTTVPFGIKGCSAGIQDNPDSGGQRTGIVKLDEWGASVSGGGRTESPWAMDDYWPVDNSATKSIRSRRKPLLPGDWVEHHAPVDHPHKPNNPRLGGTRH